MRRARRRIGAGLTIAAQRAFAACMPVATRRTIAANGSVAVARTCVARAVVGVAGGLAVARLFGVFRGFGVDHRGSRNRRVDGVARTVLVASLATTAIASTAARRRIAADRCFATRLGRRRFRRCGGFAVAIGATALRRRVALRIKGLGGLESG